ncbi:MAG TPA: hypothetical protein VF666_15635 [Pyrinomonadaceae bacterium]|jgi:hypothetical protein
MQATTNQSDVHRGLRVIFCLLAALLGALHAWNARHAMNPDGISYLDMGDAAMRGDWSMAFNGLWSPLYGWLIGFVLAVVEPTAYWEVPLVHFVNFIIYLLALICFDFFLHEMIRYLHGHRDGATSDARKPLPTWAWTVLGYPLFMWAALYLNGLAAVTPDMLMSASVYLATAILLRIRGGRAGWLEFAALGVVLGFGYLAKASMFPLAFVFLLSSLFAFGNLRRAVPRASLALCVFLAVGSLYFVPLSLAKGRLTFGDSGMLNYAWYVNQTTLHVHWQGEPRGNGTPAHPTRKVHDAPAVYEFRTPIKATYAPWYDPSYWYEGVRARFDFAGQRRVLKRNVAILYNILFAKWQAVWMVGFLILFLSGCRRPSSCLKRLAEQWYLLLPALAAMGMYALVRVEARYVAVFIVLLALGLFSGVRLAERRAGERLAACIAVVVASVLLVGFVPSTFVAARSLVHNLTRGEDVSDSPHWQVAEGLKRMDVERDDEVASIGYGFNALWARLARVRIVAEITSGSLEAPATDVEEFWAADSSAQTRIIELFARTGAKVVVADSAPDGASASGWQRVNDTKYHVYVLAR